MSIIENNTTIDPSLMQTHVRETGCDYEILGVQWYTLLAVGIITATGIALLATTQMPAAIVISVMIALDSAIIAEDLIGKYLFSDDSTNPASGGSAPVSNSIPHPAPYSALHPVSNSVSNPVGHRLAADSRIDPDHFRVISDFENNIPVPAMEVNLNMLREYFDEMNILEEFCDDEETGLEPHRREDYVDPNRIQDDNRAIPIADLRGYMDAWIRHIQNREDASGVPHSAQEREKYYGNVEKLIKHILIKISEINTPLIATHPGLLDLESDEEVARTEQVKKRNLVNQVLQRFATGFGHCGGRVMTEAIECYEILVLEQENNTFEKQLEQRLHQYRRAVISDIAREINPDGDGFHAHVVIRLLNVLGPTRGIMGGVAGDYDDPYRQRISEDQAYNSFDQNYTRQKMIEFVLNGITGIISDTGSAFRQFDIEGVLNWFRDHMPQEWAERTDAVENGYVDAWDQCLRAWVYDENGVVQEEAVVYLLRTLHYITE